MLKQDESNPWEFTWSQGCTPWDAGAGSPALAWLFDPSAGTGDKPSLPGTRALVPGSGSSYDAIMLSNAGYDTLALDISPTAVRTAQRLFQEAEVKPGAGSLKAEVADFFHHRPVKPYDLIVDYTFLCSFPPSERMKYARNMRHLLAPSGNFVLQIFPIDTYPEEQGPPYAQDVDAIMQDFTAAGFELAWAMPVPAEHSHRARAGREMLTVWRHDVRRFPRITTKTVKPQRT